MLHFHSRLMPAIATLGCLLDGSQAWAQILPDDTLGAQSSVVTPQQMRDLIEGGAIRDSNLFHSFVEFNVNEGQQVDFANPAGIINILTRVTGANPSQIFGTLGVEGEANLFLINPQGIIFGNNASLDVGGSFLATTANAIGFGEQGFFSATQPEAPPLLTVNPSVLLFNQGGTGTIVNQSVAPAGVDVLGVPIFGLRIPDGQSLALVGGEVLLDGGNINALGGKVALAAVAGVGEVGLNIAENNLDLSVPEDVAVADIFLSNAAFVNTGGERGGDVDIWGNNVILTDGGRISANNLGAGAGGSLTVNASESVQLIGISPDGRDLSGLFAIPIGSGEGGNLTVITKNFLVEGGAQAGVGTFGEGLGGNFNIIASESVRVIGESVDGRFFSNLFALTAGTGNAGNLFIDTKNLLVTDGAQISSGTFADGDGGNLIVNASESVELIGVSGDGQFPSGLFSQADSDPQIVLESGGNAGDLTITTQALIVRDGAAVGASTLGDGDGGNLTINASQSVQILGTSADGLILSGIFAQTSSPGNAGNLTINTGQLLITDGATASTATRGEGSGSAGKLTITASDWVQLIGTSADGQFSSALSTATDGTGDASDLTITTERLIVQDGAQISAATSGGAGGGVIVNANRLEVFNRGQILTTTFGNSDAGNISINVDEQIALRGTDSGIFANTAEDSNGNGGSIFIDPQSVIIQDGAQISVSSQGSGEGGNIELIADLLSLDNGALISAETLSNTGGDITLQIADLLLLRNASNISTSAGTAQAGGDGGNISINLADGFLVALPDENSDITANAFEGRGGNINIAAQGVFGIEFRGNNTDLSDITASSEFGVDGVVEIDTPEVDPSRGLANLPSEPGIPPTLQGCQVAAGSNTSQFINSGRGGLPTVPTQPLDSSDILDDLQLPEGWGVDDSNNSTTRDRIIEAQGWIMNAQGNVVLVTEVPALLRSCTN